MSLVQIITGIAHVGIRVHTLDRARAFYELLGFHFVIGPIGPEPVAIMKHPSGVEINFILNADGTSTQNVLMDLKEKHPGYTHIALSVKDVLKVQSVLISAGVTITEGPVTFTNGSTAIFVRDPDRNVIEFNQPAK